MIPSCFHLIVADGHGGTSVCLLVWDTGGISSNMSAKGCAGTLYSCCGAVTTLAQAHLEHYLTDIQQWSREQYDSSACGDASSQHCHLAPFAEVHV